MKKAVLLLFIVFVSSCKTYEETAKIQEFSTLTTYYEKIKKQSSKELKSLAFQMRENNLTFSDVKSVNKLLNNKERKVDLNKLTENGRI